MRIYLLPITKLLFFSLIAVTLIYDLDTKSLWLDEGYSLHDAKHLKGFNINIRPLYYLVLHAWMSLGESIFWLRSLSVIFALFSLYQVLILASYLKLPAIASYLAVLLIALSPNFIRHSQEVRMYTLGILLSLLGSIAVLRLLEEPKIRLWILWAVLRICAFLTIPLSASIIASDVIIISTAFLRVKQKNQLKNFIITLLAIFIFCLPFAIGQVFASAWFMDGWIKRIPKPDALLFIRMLLEDITVSRVSLFNKSIVSRLVFYGLMLFLFILPFFNKKYRSQSSYLLLWTLVPALILAVVSQIKSSLWVERYIIFVLPYLLLLIANGLVISWKYSKVFVGFFLIIYVCFAVSGVMKLRHPGGQSWVTAAANFDMKVGPEDTVLSAQSERIFYSMRYYLNSTWNIYFHENRSVNNLLFLTYLKRLFENPFKEPHRPIGTFSEKLFSTELRERALLSKGRIWILFSEKQEGSHDKVKLESVLPSDAIDPRSPAEKCADKSLSSQNLFCKIAKWDSSL